MPSEPRPRYSVVIPVYGNEATLPTVVETMEQLAHDLEAPLEVVFVVDGSPDGSLILLRRLLADTGAFVSQLISLSRNYGSLNAVRTGLAASEGEYVAVMAADMQEPVTLVEDFFAVLARGEADIALGVRTGRDDPGMAKGFSNAYWWLYRRFVQRDVPRSGVDVFGVTRQVVTELVRLGESHTSLVGLLFWLGFRRVEVPYVRAARAHGRSAWSFRRRLRYLLDSVFSFTDLPVLLITTIGIVGVLGSVVLGLAVLVAWIAGSIQVAGYTPLMLVLVFTASSVLFALGVIGSYVWRTYENTKGRPSAIPMSHERFGSGT